MISELITAVSTCVKLINLFTEEKVSYVVRDIGDSHFKAAKFVIDNFNTENDKLGAIQRILTHLESSYQIYRTQGSHEKIRVVLLLIMVCHKILGNDETISKWFNEYYIVSDYYAIVADEAALKCLVNHDDYNARRKRLLEIKEENERESEYSDSDWDRGGFHFTML